MSETIAFSSLRRTLRRRFGFRSLREGQEEVIRSVLDGRDTLAILPTGAGKSLCYQLPATSLPGMTVVVSPLLSLIKDQVEKLEELGFEPAQVNSALTAREESAVLEEIANSRRDFVFVTPERLAQPEFLETLRQNQVSLFVIDEAHCLSDWGHDFRPAYLELRGAISALGDPPVLALTATASERVIDDIRRHLGREEMQVIDTGLYRENLKLSVLQTPDEEHKLAALGRLLKTTEGIGIVYTATVRDCEAVADHLASLGHAVARYHGRMRTRDRIEAQDRFMAGELAAIVATNAFGLGIDKPDIRFVVHYSLPGSLESYYQEAGRAGRDGEPSDCVLLYQAKDRNTQQFFLNGRYPTAEHFTAVYRALERLGADGESVTATAVQEAVPSVPRTKTSVVIAALQELGLAEETGKGKLRLASTGLAAAELEEIATRYREREEGDRERLRRMVHYAQTRLCRWKTLLEPFGETLPEESCGTCDNCLRPVAAPSLKTESRDERAEWAMPFSPVPAGGTLRPLAPLLGERDLAGLAGVKPGDVLTLPIYGTGTVESFDGRTMGMIFQDGERRAFECP